VTGSLQTFVSVLRRHLATDGERARELVVTTSLHTVVARIAGESVAAAIVLDLDGDCGIYNVGTL
jgi:regulator of extracellular matrix RemA (YlzA/DUF370 family)